jgi:hypothetical protein
MLYVVTTPNAGGNFTWATRDRSEAERDFQRIAAESPCWLISIHKTVRTPLACSIKR